MSKLISANQSAFIKGRLISDNIMVAHECMHYLKNKRNSETYEFALKLDMSKAYDRVEWSFIWFIMEKLGFCSRWLNWIKECVTTVSYSVVAEGIPTGFLNQIEDYVKVILYHHTYSCFVLRVFLICFLELNTTTQFKA